MNRIAIIAACAGLSLCCALPAQTPPASPPKTVYLILAVEGEWTSIQKQRILAMANAIAAKLRSAGFGVARDEHEPWDAKLRITYTRGAMNEYFSDAVLTSKESNTLYKSHFLSHVPSNGIFNDWPLIGAQLKARFHDIAPLLTALDQGVGPASGAIIELGKYPSTESVSALVNVATRYRGYGLQESALRSLSAIVSSTQDSSILDEVRRALSDTDWKSKVMADTNLRMFSQSNYDRQTRLGAIWMLGELREASASDRLDELLATEKDAEMVAAIREARSKSK